MTTSQSSCASTFRKIFDEFVTQSSISHSELSDLQTTSLLDLQTDISRIQNRQKINVYLGRLSPFLEGLEDFVEVSHMFLDLTSYIPTVWVCRQRVIDFASINVFQGLTRFLLNVCSSQ